MTNFQNNMLEPIDKVIEAVLIQQTPHFNEAANYYSDYRSTDYVAFETMVNAELYKRLQEEFSTTSVFMEFPGLGQERVDIHIRHIQNGKDDLLAYIETKMYYARDKKSYTKDFETLKEFIDSESNTMAVQIHFNLHHNRNHPNEKIMISLADTLSVNDYWKQLKKIGDGNIYFFRLAFAQK